VFVLAGGGGVLGVPRDKNEITQNFWSKKEVGVILLIGFASHINGQGTFTLTAGKAKYSIGTPPGEGQADLGSTCLNMKWGLMRSGVCFIQECPQVGCRGGGGEEGGGESREVYFCRGRNKAEVQSVKRGTLHSKPLSSRQLKCLGRGR